MVKNGLSKLISSPAFALTPQNVADMSIAGWVQEMDSMSVRLNISKVNSKDLAMKHTS